MTVDAWAPILQNKLSSEFARTKGRLKRPLHGKAFLPFAIRNGPQALADRRKRFASALATLFLKAYPFALTLSRSATQID